MISHPCFVCGAAIEGDDVEAYGAAGLAHVRAFSWDICAELTVQAYRAAAERHARA